MMYSFLIVIHVLICIVMVLVVLLQSSKGGGLAGAFGGAGGAPQQLLGSRGMTTLLHKLTIYCAIGFFMTSFLLFMTDSSGDIGGGGVLSKAAREGDLDLPFQESVLPGAVDEAPADTPVDVGGGDEGAGDSN